MAAPAANNWISLPFSPIEMLVRSSCDPAFPFHYPAPPPPAAAASYPYDFLNLEDLLIVGGHRSSETLADAAAAAAPAGPDDDSMTSAVHDLQLLAAVGSEIEDSASATGNMLSLAGVPSPESGADFALSGVAQPQPLAIEERTPKAVTAGSGQRTSVYRGVTKHRWTGRFEAHLWDNTCRREGQKRKGRQVYLGGYDNEEKAARAYDLAALKYWGLNATTNFPVKTYCKEMEMMKNMTKQEFIASLRRRSSGFSRGASIYRGVTRHHQHGRWQARIGRVAGNKDLYLGTFATEEEAAEAYDVAAIKFRGINAVTNFEFSRYDMEAISSSELPIGASAKKLKQSLQADGKDIQITPSSSAISQHAYMEPTSLFQNLLHLQSADSPSVTLAYTGLSETIPDIATQSLYWLSGCGQKSNQISDSQLPVGSEILQLTYFENSQ